MKVCDAYHEQVVYDETKCPVCERMEEIDRLVEDLKDANEAVATLEKDVKDLQLELEQERQHE